MNQSSISQSQASQISKIDAVLLDNDMFVHLLWKSAAKRQGIHLLTFNNSKDFISIVDKLRKNTPIFLDSDLNEALRGEELACKLREMGFQDLTLVTGFSPEEFSAYPWLKVLGKNPPFDASLS